MNRVLSLVLPLFCILTLSGKRGSAQEQDGLLNAFVAQTQQVSPREQMAEISRGFNAPTSVQRLKWIQSAGAQTDEALLREFDIPDKLVDIVKGEKTVTARVVSPRERIEAMRSLVMLNRNGIKIPTILDLLSDIVTKVAARGEPMIDPSIKTFAMVLIVEVANKGDDLARDRAFAELKRMYIESARPSSKFPTRLRAQLVYAMAGFHKVDDVMPILMDALEDRRSKAVNEAGLRGIIDYLRATGKTASKDLFDTISRSYLRVADDPKEERHRTYLLQCLSVIVSNAPDRFRLSNRLRDSIVGRLHKGTDEEATAALWFLLSIADDNLKIIDDIIQESVNTQARDIETLTHFNQALVELLLRVAQSEKKNTAQNEAQKIIDHFIKILHPAAAANTPPEIRRGAVIGLGSIPISFDRQKAVNALIDLLGWEAEREKSQAAMITEIEKSLTQLTAMQPFRKIEVVQGKDDDEEGGDQPKAIKRQVPDIQAWLEWFKENREWLAPNKHPIEKPE